MPVEADAQPGVNYSRRAARIPRRDLRGPAAIGLGALFFGIMAIAAKFATRELPAGEVVMFRFLQGLLVMQVLSATRRIRISHTRWPLLALRGITGGAAILLYFTSIQATTLTKATLLGNAYPVFATLFGVLLLGEHMSWPIASALCAAAAGGWMLIDPEFGEIAVGDLYGAGAAAVSGLAIVTIRELRKTESAFSVFYYLCVAGTLIGAAMCWGCFVWPSSAAWGFLLLLGATSTAGQLLITYGYRWCRAGEGALISMTTVVYSGVFGFLFLGDELTKSGAAGALIILLSAAYLATSAHPRR